MSLPTSVQGVLRGLRLPGYTSPRTARTAKAMPQDQSSGAPSNRALKRKAEEIEEAETQPSPLSSQLSHEPREAFGDWIRKEESAEVAAGSPVASNGAREHSNSSRSVSRSTSTENEKEERSYTPRSSFTPINPGGAREPENITVSQSIPCDGDNGVVQLQRNAAGYQEDSPASIGPTTERLLGIDANRLLEAVAEVEAAFEKERWNLVAEAMKRSGARDYSTELLEKEYAQLSQASSRLDVPGFGARVVNTETAKSRQLALNAGSLNDVMDSTPVHIPAKTPTESFGGFGVLVSQGSLQYATQRVPPNIRSRMAQQENRNARPAAHQTGTIPPQSNPQSNPQTPSAYSTTAPLHRSFSQQSAQGLSPLEKPPQQAGRQPQSTPSDAPGRDANPVPQDNPQTPTSVASFAPQENQSNGRKIKSVSKAQLKYMLRHRTLNDTNKHKPWNVIAQECGVDAPLADISQALEEAGFPSILYTPTGAPIFVSNPASSNMPPGSAGYVSPYTSMPSAAPAASNVVPSSPAPIDLTDHTGNPTPTVASLAASTGRGAGEGPTPSASQPVPDQNNGFVDKSTDSHSIRSAAMKKAWAKRQAEGRNGRGGGAPRSSTISRKSLKGGSPTAIAAQVVAAESTETQPSPRMPQQETEASRRTPPPPQQPTTDEAPSIKSSSESRSQTSKKRGPYKSPGVSDADALANVETPPQHPNHPYQNTFSGEELIERPCPYACEKCGKAYTTPGGLSYHRASRPNCETEPAKPRPYACEKCGKSYQNRGGLRYHREHYPDCESESLNFDRSGGPSGQSPKDMNGPKVIGGAGVDAMEQPAAHSEAQPTSG